MKAQPAGTIRRIHTGGCYMCGCFGKSTPAATARISAIGSDAGSGMPAEYGVCAGCAAGIGKAGAPGGSARGEL